MKIQIHLFALLIAFGIVSNLMSQNSYSFESYPDSSQVFLNGVLVGHTPCQIRQSWTGKPLDFTIRKPGYQAQKVSITERPKFSGTRRSIELQRDFSFQIDSTSSLVEYGKMGATFPVGEVIGHTNELGASRELTWEGFAGIDHESYAKKTHEILQKAGFHTTDPTETRINNIPQKGRNPKALLLGGKITALSIEIYIDEAATWQRKYVGRIEMGIEWQVFDSKHDKLIYSQATLNKTVHRSGIALTGSILLDGYQVALEEFLLNGKVAELANSSGSIEISGQSKTSEEKYDRHIPKLLTRRFLNNAEMIQNATASCATIQTEIGHGSGVFISSNGHLLTAYHVINDVRSIDVILSNGTTSEAELVVYDAFHDVALLKIRGSGYDALPIGNSQSAGLGTDVFTIGTPSDLELGQSVSKGIVSGKRKVEEITYIQTDVSVSPGNSGGPLINPKGEIIGIIQKKLIGNGIEGIGFALPIETVLKQLGITIE